MVCRWLTQRVFRSRAGYRTICSDCVFGIVLARPMIHAISLRAWLAEEVAAALLPELFRSHSHRTMRFRVSPWPTTREFY